VTGRNWGNFRTTSREIDRNGVGFYLKIKMYGKLLFPLRQNDGTTLVLSPSFARAIKVVLKPGPLRCNLGQLSLRNSP
jgi:hypothetical protein